MWWFFFYSLSSCVLIACSPVARSPAPFTSQPATTQYKYLKWNLMKRPNHEQIHRPKHQPHAVLLIILMSSICKLPKKTLIDIQAALEYIATAILSAIHLIAEQNIIKTELRPPSNHHRRSRRLSCCRHSTNNNRQHAQIQQTSPSHERIVVKPNLLATNLVNTLMISLYITLFVSLSIYPVSVLAVSKYKTVHFHLSKFTI